MSIWSENFILNRKGSVDRDMTIDLAVISEIRRRLTFQRSSKAESPKISHVFNHFDQLRRGLVMNETSK